MVIAEILLSIVVVLGTCFYVFLMFWEKGKSKKNYWALKFASLSIILLSVMGVLIFDIINQESTWWMRVLMLCLWVIVLVLNAITFYLNKKTEQKKSKKKENS